MTAKDETLYTGGKRQPDSERRCGIAKQTCKLVPDRKHHQFLLDPELLQEGIHSFLLLDTSSITDTSTAGEEISFCAARKFRRIFAA